VEVSAAVVKGAESGRMVFTASTLEDRESVERSDQYGITPEIVRQYSISVSEGNS